MNGKIGSTLHQTQIEPYDLYRNTLGPTKYPIQCVPQTTRQRLVYDNFCYFRSTSKIFPLFQR